MRRRGTPEQLAQRRAIAMRLLDEGKSYSEVAALVESSKSSVCRWNQARRCERQTTKKSARSRPSRRVRLGPGRPCKLSAAQIRRLQRELNKGAYAHGYAGDFWTLERMAHLIFQLFQVRYHPSSVWHLMGRIGWSCQKPRRLAVQRDEETIALWRRRVFPQLKKR